MTSDSYSAASIYWLDGTALDYDVSMSIVTANFLGSDGASSTSIATI